MSEKLINTYQIILQTLLCVILMFAAYNARLICKEQACIKAELDKLKMNQIKILTLLKTEPVSFDHNKNTFYDWPVQYQTSQ